MKNLTMSVLYMIWLAGYLVGLAKVGHFYCVPLFICLGVIVLFHATANLIVES